MKINEIVTPEKIIWKEIENNSLVLEFIEEISSKINSEDTIQNCYHYALEKSINKKLTVREYNLIKNIFSIYGWAFEMHSQKDMKDNNLYYYNILIRPIKQIYL